MAKAGLAQEVKERPLLMCGEMVRATLADLKTETRRTRGLEKMNADKDAWRYDGMNINGDHLFYDVHAAITGHDPQDCVHIIKCPYGKPGDRLWVRETWRERGSAQRTDDRLGVGPAFYRDALYRADGNEWDGPWRPSIFMPRAASRVTLELTDVRAERAQDITAADCMAEGFIKDPLTVKHR